MQQLELKIGLSQMHQKKSNDRKANVQTKYGFSNKMTIFASTLLSLVL